MDHSQTSKKIKDLLNKDNIPFIENKVAVFSSQGEVKSGPVVVGNFDRSEVTRIEEYLELAGYYPKVDFLENGDVIVAGDGTMLGYVEEFDEDEIEYEF